MALEGLSAIAPTIVCAFRLHLSPIASEPAWLQLQKFLAIAALSPKSHHWRYPKAQINATRASFDWKLLIRGEVGWLLLKRRKLLTQMFLPEGGK